MGAAHVPFRWPGLISAVAFLLFGCATDRNPSEVDSSVENTNETCRDGIDNDGDGLIDCADFGCQPGGEPIEACRGDGTDEAGEELCGDGIDNDNDGETDCNDDKCREGGASFCVEGDTEESCSDSSDNDGNGFIDCEDFACDAYCE